MIITHNKWIGEINFICEYLHYVTSIEQPEHGEYVIAAVRKCTFDARLLSMSNKEF